MAFSTISKLALPLEKSVRETNMTGSQRRTRIFTPVLLLAGMLIFHAIPVAQAAPKNADQPLGNPDIIGLPESSRTDPSNVIKAYYTFVSAGKINEALDLLGPSFGIEAVRTIAEENQNLHQRINAGEISISLDQIVQQGDWALAVLVVDAKTPSGDRRLVADQYLLRVNNRWTVVPKQLRHEPQFASFFDGNAMLLNQWWQENRGKITQKLNQDNNQ